MRNELKIGKDDLLAEMEDKEYLYLIEEKSIHFKTLFNPQDNSIVFVYADPAKKGQDVSIKLYESPKLIKNGTDFSIKFESLRVSLSHCIHFKDEMPAIFIDDTIFVKSQDVAKLFQMRKNAKAYQIIYDSETLTHSTKVLSKLLNGHCYLQNVHPDVKMDNLDVQIKGESLIFPDQLQLTFANQARVITLHDLSKHLS